MSTLQSATGIAARKLVQKSLGMSAGTFNTREFFHGASQLALRNVRWVFVLGLFVLTLTLQFSALPIAATYTGLTLATGPGEKIRVRLDPTNPAKDSITFKTA